MNKKTIIRILLLLTMIIIVGFDYSFADNTATTSAKESLGFLASILHFLISFASWIRIFFANTAGQMLTNAWVYAPSMGIDVFLRICWNTVKNIANFALGFIFVYYLFMAVFNAESVGTIIKNIITKILIAGIGIQASWFLVAAILDISTIAVITVGTIPSQLISDNAHLAEGMRSSELMNQLTNGINSSRDTLGKIEHELFPQQGQSLLNIKVISGTVSATEGSFEDLFTPNGNSLAGPLVFLGLGILDSYSISSVDLTQPATALIKILMEGFGIVLYTIAMVLLCILAFIRIFYLWMFIVLSPILVLLFCLGMGKDNMKGIERMTKTLKEKGISVSGFLGIAFKPVIITLGISLALIFTVFMKRMITTEPDLEIINKTFIRYQNTDSNNTSGRKRYKTTFDNPVLKVTVSGISKTFSDLILTIITLVFVRLIVKLAFSSKTGIKSIDDFTTNTIKGVEDFGKNIPFIPVGGQMLSAQSISGLAERIEGETRNLARPSQSSQDAIDKLIGKFLPGATPPIGPNEYRALNSAARIASTEHNKFVTETRNISKAGKTIGLTDPDRTKYFLEWIKNLPTSGTDQDVKKLQEARKITTGASDNEKLGELFKHDQNIKAYWKTFGGDPDKAPKDLTGLQRARNFHTPF